MLTGHPFPVTFVPRLWLAAGDDGTNGQARSSFLISLILIGKEGSPLLGDAAIPKRKAISTKEGRYTIARG